MIRRNMLLVVPDYPTDRTLYNYYKEVSYGMVRCRHAEYAERDGLDTRPEIHMIITARLMVSTTMVLDPIRRTHREWSLMRSEAVDPYVDFNNYAVNGEVPNLFVVFAGTGAEWSGDPEL